MPRMTLRKVGRNVPEPSSATAYECAIFASIRQKASGFQRRKSKAILVARSKLTKLLLVDTGNHLKVHLGGRIFSNKHRRWRKLVCHEEKRKIRGAQFELGDRLVLNHSLRINAFHLHLAQDE